MEKSYLDIFLCVFNTKTTTTKATIKKTTLKCISSIKEITFSSFQLAIIIKSFSVLFEVNNNTERTFNTNIFKEKKIT